MPPVYCEPSNLLPHPARTSTVSRTPSKCFATALSPPPRVHPIGALHTYKYAPKRGLDAHTQPALAAFAQLAREEHMGHFAFGWKGKEPAPAASPSGAGATLPLQSIQGTAAATTGADTAHCLDPATYAPAVLATVPPTIAEAGAKRRQDAENIALYLIHILHKCAEAIEAGDYAVATGKLTEALMMLVTAVIHLHRIDDL